MTEEINELNEQMHIRNKNKEYIYFFIFRLLYPVFKYVGNIVVKYYLLNL